MTFYDSIVRGSQYRVESFLFLEARANNFIVGPSPTPFGVSQMKATEAAPLVAEP